MGLGRMASIQDPTGVRVNLWQAGQSIGSVRVNEPGCPIWHELTSPDLPTATKFYSEVLGVEWESMPMETGDVVLIKDAAGEVDKLVAALLKEDADEVEA